MTRNAENMSRSPETRRRVIVSSTSNSSSPLRGGVEPLKYVLRISGFETLKEERYTVYFVRVSVESQEMNMGSGKRLWYIKKRFRDFYNLRQGIIEVNGIAPELPQKRYFGNKDPEFLKMRAHGLSTFVWELAASPPLCAIRCVHDFLWSDVCVPPTRGLLPSTPVISRATMSSTSLTGFESVATMSLDDLEALEQQEQRGKEEAELVERAASDIADVQGCMVLKSCEDLQRSFANEGIVFPEDDLVQSDSNDDDDDDPSFLVKACSSFMPGLYKWYTGKEQQEPFSPVARSQFQETSQLDAQRIHTLDTVEFLQASVEDDDEIRKQLVPKLRFVIVVVGSRGDVQPYIALGMALTRRGHYVRVCAHECFRGFVKEHGLGFAPLAGDPKELLRMVTEHNMFSYEFIKQGLTTHRVWVEDILHDAWDACTLEEDRLRHEGEEIDRDPRKREAKATKNIAQGPGFAYAARGSSFRADAVIANPPAFSGWHIAEALGIPLYMSFPMAWSRTGSFPSPFTSAQEGSSAKLNWFSFGAVERLMWVGSGDIINRWRIKTLKLPPIWTLSARGHRLVHDNKVPFIYPWSPQLLPKPPDWGAHISIPGYWFLDDEKTDVPEFTPDEELANFLAAGDPPVFIGFGSIVVTNPEKLSKIIVDSIAAMTKNHRFVVQSGWANLDISRINTLPEAVSSRVLHLGPVPHRWLFERCKLVVHHGGAGTTAEGLRAGKPSVVVPFFGDQFFWAKQIHDCRVGTKIPYTKLTAAKLCIAMESVLGTGTRMRAQVLGTSIQRERGTDVAIAFIERQFLKLDMIRGKEAVPLDMNNGKGLKVADRPRFPSVPYTGELSDVEQWQNKHIVESDYWRYWPYTDWSDKAVDKSIIAKPFHAMSSLSKSVQVVGSAIKHTLSPSSHERRSSMGGVQYELKQFSVTTSSTGSKFPPKDFGKEPPVGHTRFSWFTQADGGSSAMAMVGHTKFSQSKV